MIKTILVMRVLQNLFGRSNFTTKYKPDFRELTFDEFEKVKFKSRIALVDDEEVTYVKRLQNEGYNITLFPDIANIDEFLRKKYNVVILDIQGIGKEISPKNEGWGILKYIKHECPNIVVIMFTGADWSITKYKDLADLADEFIGKDLEYLEFKSKLDNAIRKAISSKFQLDIQKKHLQKIISNAETVNQIGEIVNAHISNEKKALKEVNKITSNAEVLKSISTFFEAINNIKEMLN